MSSNAADSSSSEQLSLAHRILNFDIDVHLNPFVLPSPLVYLPRHVSHWLGHRDANDKEDKTCNLVQWMWAFIGAFCGIALIEGVYRSSSAIQTLQPPIIIASFGAAAILEYNAIESPLSQPRNLVLGQIFSATIGVAITKLFLLLPQDRFADLQWLAGALAVGTASFVMSATKTVHPPAGATALLAATSSDIIHLGWWLLPLDLIASCLMLGSALVINNIQRRFPYYWWTPMDLRKARKPDTESSDIEKVPTKQASDPSRAPQESKEKLGSDIKSVGGSFYSESSSASISSTNHDQIVITARGISVPDWMEINDWKAEILEILRQRLAEHGH